MLNALPLPDIQCVLRIPALLGESPVWCHRDQVLYWVDIKNPAVHRFHPATGASNSWPMPEDVGSIGLRENGGVVAALRTGFATLDFRTGEVHKFGALEFDVPDMRFNDGRCDRRGRFWAGTLHEKRVPETASIYRLEADGACSPVIEKLTVSNGITWSPDGRTMYFADSWTRTIFCCHFDGASGAVGDRRIFAELAPGAGVPDGATTDVKGFLWSAHFDGACVTRYAPDGKIDRVIPMPVTRPTSCTFGGENLDILYVTSASYNLTAEQRAAQPLAGSVFAIDVGVKGLVEPRFAG